MSSTEPDRHRPEVSVDAGVDPAQPPTDRPPLEFTGCPECGQPAEVITAKELVKVWCVMRHEFSGPRDELLPGG